MVGCDSEFIGTSDTDQPKGKCTVSGLGVIGEVVFGDGRESVNEDGVLVLEFAGPFDPTEVGELFEVFEIVEVLSHGSCGRTVYFNNTVFLGRESDSLDIRVVFIVIVLLWENGYLGLNYGYSVNCVSGVSCKS